MLRLNRRGQAGLLAAGLALMIIATSCTSPSSAPATVTVTAAAAQTTTATNTAAATATSTVTTTNTITATLPAVSSPPTPPPASSQAASDLSSQLQKNNNGHFLIGREVTEYTKTLQQDGSYIQTPVYRFVYYDFDLLSFTTNQGAIFVPRIPTFTDYDDWFVKFSTLSFLYPTPFKINWSFVTKSGSLSPNTSMRFYTQSFFEANYYKSPGSLAINNLTSDLSVNGEGVHFAEISLYENFVALIRTDNPANILGWWIKIGSLH